MELARTDRILLSMMHNAFEAAHGYTKVHGYSIHGVLHRAVRCLLRGNVVKACTEFKTACAKDVAESDREIIRTQVWMLQGRSAWSSHPVFEPLRDALDALTRNERVEALDHFRKATAAYEVTP